DGKEYVDDAGNPLSLDDIDGPVYLNFGNVQTATGPGVTGQVATSSNWNIQRAANSRYQVDNWPVEMESATNKISDVIEGVVFTIQDVGDARISVSTDITSVEQSIQNFLDAVNSVLLTINELTKYDETKEVTSNDPDDIGKDNYSPSGLTNQKGGLLQGNYGVQLFKSRFSNVLSSSPPGFKSRQSATDILSGDVLASLANLGIKTDTDQNSDTYGLLVMAPSSSIAELQSMDKENYTNMITNNLEAVVDFFCASGTGSSTSSDFRYGSHVEGITKGGNYEVRYTVDDDGNITSVTVGGVEAKRDESQPGYYYSVASGDARGLSILIDDLTPGEHPPAGKEPMYVRIKQGLVQTTNSFLKDELVFNDVNISSNSTPDQIADAMALKAKNGALMSLRDNYMTVMENIDAKIEREQRRLDMWESRQKQIFANLETLLKQYGDQQTSLEAQLKQLSGNS
ncbi:flagellar filament capping protein FliD, partial [uncultured Desulfovibrio sp.]